MKLLNQTDLAALARPALDAADALAHIRAGGTAFLPGNEGTTFLTPHVLARFDKAEARLLWDDGQGIRLARGRGSVYLFANQLILANAARRPGSRAEESTMSTTTNGSDQEVR